jgi:hypothetical protein
METKRSLSSYSIALGIIAFAFLAGLTAGCLLSLRGGADADSAVAGYLSPLAQYGAPRPDVLRVAVNAFIFPALCFALGFAIPGVALIPLTVFARGFLVSYASSSLAGVFGAVDGTLFSLSLFGLPLLLSLPPLLWIAAHGLLGSIALLGSARRKPGAPLQIKAGFTRFGAALCVLTASAAAELYFSPMMAAIVAQRL